MAGSERPRAAWEPGGSSPSGTAPSPSGSGASLPGAGEERYRLVEELGRGASGTVYRAFDRIAGEMVALKVLSAVLTDETLERLRRELRAARRVTHPGVVRLHDLFAHHGTPALAMELVEGETLQAALARDGQMPADRLIPLVRDLAIAVAAAHKAGVVHRDLKPANVLLRRANGRPVVTDFGISRFGDGEPLAVAGEHAASPTASPTLTMEGALLGTPLYMAPEQLEGAADVGPAADVYAIGLVAWEAATGKALNAGATVGELLLVRTEPRDVPLHARRPDLPEWFCDVVKRCLAPAVADRFPSAVELRAALESQQPPPAAAAPARWPARAWWAAGALGVALVGAAAWARTHPPARAVPAPAAAATPAPWIAHIRQLSSEEQNLDRPALSPDGASIAVPSTRGGHWDLWLFDRRHATWRALTDDAGLDASPQWVEAGRAVVFYSERDGKRGLFRLALATGARPEYLEPAVFVNLGASRDGARVFFSRDEHDVWQLDMTTRAASRLGAVGPDERILSLTSDEAGARIVAAVQRRPADAKQSPESTNDLYVFDVAAHTGAWITTDALWHGTAAFVPGDATALVSSSRRSGQLNLWRVATDGRPPLQLTAGSGDDIYATPAWDGKTLLYVHDQTVRQLFVRGPHATQWAKLTHEAIDHQGPSFDAAGTRLFFCTFDRDGDVRDGWEAAAPRFDPPQRIALPLTPIRVAPTPDGARWIALAHAGKENDLVAIDRATSAVTPLASKLMTTDFSVSSDGARVAYAQSNEARVVALGGGEPVVIAGGLAIEMSPRAPAEAAVLVAAGAGKARIEIHDLRDPAHRRARTLGETADSARVAWAADGASLWLVPAFEPTLRRLDAKDGHLVETIAAPGDNTLSLAAAADGTLIAESSEGRSRLFVVENFGDSSVR